MVVAVNRAVAAVNKVLAPECTTASAAKRALRPARKFEMVVGVDRSASDMTARD